MSSRRTLVGGREHVEGTGRGDPLDDGHDARLGHHHDEAGVDPVSRHVADGNPAVAGFRLDDVVVISADFLRRQHCHRALVAADSPLALGKEGGLDPLGELHLSPQGVPRLLQLHEEGELVLDELIAHVVDADGKNGGGAEEEEIVRQVRDGVGLIRDQVEDRVHEEDQQRVDGGMKSPPWHQEVDADDDQDQPRIVGRVEAPQVDRHERDDSPDLRRDHVAVDV